MAACITTCARLCFTQESATSDTCGVDGDSPSHHHSLMFEVRIFIQGQGVDAASLYTHCPAGGDTHEVCVHVRV